MSAEPPLPHTSDIVVIGCSAGGVEALPRILQQLSGDLAAAVFIVQHLAAEHPPYLAGILGRASRLPVAWAEQGAEIAPGRVLIAPPDLHMVLSERHVQLTRDARENYARPSIDKLFRSAAAVHGSRVIGVLLTGMLDDGVAGLHAIREAGGVVIVQDPRDAAFPELPARALLAVVPDQTLPIDAIGAAIASLVGDRVGVAGTPSERAADSEIDRASAVEVESALWSAVRALNDRANTLETLAADSRRIGDGLSAQAYAIRGRAARHQAEIARRFMRDLGRSK